MNLLLSVGHLLIAKSPEALAHSAAYLLLSGGGLLGLRWFLRKDLPWVSTTLGALGLVVLTVILITATDFVFPYQPAK
ncbi:hypothetical protein HHL22_19575 [Hymenobacter sp. RP-2-7]|uniref:Uncharacterized protein n=1 Tax=Hymenobacter polaris TaxID=2682546 RepID=A0A7Y0FPI6_9BACT|nr:hypothetical protein [Hymenobacter polaris]NML67409.1 hypothetical protein [Hymenobacter polaris]